MKRIKSSYKEKLNILEIERTNNRLQKVKEKKFKKKPKKRKRKSQFQIKYYNYLKSDEWAEIRMEMYSMFDKCFRCGSKNKLIVHHKTYKNLFHEEPEDLELICDKCHKKEHNII